MTWFTYDDQHRDFENDPSDSSQKLKGPVSFSIEMDGPPDVRLEVQEKKKKGFVYKIRERVKDVKRDTRKLF
jgi:hypothetical protein